MKQLTGMDNYFLAAERGNVFNHVALLGIYDPSTAPNGKVRFKEILKHFSDRLHVSPVFRRKLVEVPTGIDRPYWIDVAEIDVEFHIRHIALPEPGDWRQLMIQVARLHSRPLDRSRPLWEIYVIEGLDRIPGLPAGSFALFTKFHHASVDGMAGTELLRAIHAFSLDEAPPAPATIVTDREPTTVELMTRAAINNFGRLFGMSKFYLQTSTRVSGLTLNAAWAKANPAYGAMAEPAPQLNYVRAPRTRFSEKVSANRVVEAVGLPLERIRDIRNSLPGITINDIFLSVCGGALRHYLEAKGELPPESLRALMPIALRGAGADAAKGGNDIGGTPVPLRTDIADPVERVRAVHEDAAEAKDAADVLGRDAIKSIYNEFPFAISNFVIENFILSQVNCTVSNVRGPDVPMYVAGARLVHAYPVSIPLNGVGVNFTGFSYNGVLWICAVACRNMVPDPAALADALSGSFEALAAAVNIPAVATPPKARARKPAAPRKKATPAPSTKPAPRASKADAKPPAEPKPAAKPKTTRTTKTTAKAARKPL